MKILALSDRIDDYLMTAEGLDGLRKVEAIVACGDLPFDYLEYLLTMLDVPLLYVFGNHDAPMLRESGAVTPAPEGGTNLHGRLRRVRGRSGQDLWVAGLEGSRRCGGQGHEFTESQMLSRGLRMVPRLLWNRLRHGRALDVLITHAPPAGVHEGTDPCHRGFRTHRWLIRWFRPALALHGHVHPSYGIDVRPERLGSTQVLNVFGSTVLEVHRARP
jgi:Icc-related predicted phosphoesterase